MTTTGWYFDAAHGEKMTRNFEEAREKFEDSVRIVAGRVAVFGYDELERLLAISRQEARAKLLRDEQFIQALASAALVESERIVKQVREFDRTGISTAHHREMGAQWDSCFESIFRKLLTEMAETYQEKGSTT